MLLGDLEPLIANALGDTTTAAYIEGAAASVEKVGVPVVAPAKISPADLSFIEVEFPAAKASAKSLVSKRVYTPKEFKALNNASRARAFTAAGEITQEARTRLRDRLGEMAEQGADRKAFVAEMADLPLSEPHLEQIFRNNILTAFSEGKEEVLDQPGVGEVFVYRSYDAIDDDRVRPEHLSLEKRGIQGTNIYHKDDPVWKAFRPPWSWNAIAADSIVQGRIMFGLKSRYSGDIYKFTTQRGRRFTITANHPIPTPDGFLRARQIEKGSELLAYRTPADFQFRPLDDIDDIPTPAEKIFDSLRSLSGLVSVEAPPLDLQGDAAFGDGYIHIVAANGELLHDIEAEISERDTQLSFTLADLDASFLSRQSPFSEFGFGPSASPVSGPHLGQSCRHPVPGKADCRRFGSAANLDVCRDQAAADRASADTQLFRELQFRYPSEILLDQITNIEIEHFEGSVYDFQTETGYMVADGIVVSNCRCGWSALSIRQAAAEGIKSAQESVKTGKPPKRDFVPKPPFKPSPQWRRSAGEEIIQSKTMTTTTINANRDEIRPIADPQHTITESRVQAIVDSLDTGRRDVTFDDPIYREWDLPPVVVVEDVGNGHLVLDGHHRLEAAKRIEVDTIPAWVVTMEDYNRLIEEEFAGSASPRLHDVREHINVGNGDANSVAEHGPDDGRRL